MITPALRRAAFLLLLALVTVAFFWIISPFFGAVFWAMVLAILVTASLGVLVDRRVRLDQRIQSKQEQISAIIKDLILNLKMFIFPIMRNLF